VNAKFVVKEFELFVLNDFGVHGRRMVRLA
jgi:hypothetical protein